MPTTGLVWRARAEALRLYLALSDELDETPDVIAAGINCLNESATSADHTVPGLEPAVRGTRTDLGL